MAQVDAFLKLDGIKGESVDKTHAGEIELMSWEWGMTNSGTAHTAGGAGAGKASVGDIRLTKRVDTSSATLMRACVTGKHIAKGTLVVRKAGGDKQLEYFKVELKDIMVSGVEASSAEEGSPFLNEKVKLNFAEFKITYTPQDGKGGGGAAVEFGYNLARNETV